MSKATENSSSDTNDSNYDVVCVLMILAIVVGTAVFWVSGH